MSAHEPLAEARSGTIDFVAVEPASAASTSSAFTIHTPPAHQHIPQAAHKPVTSSPLARREHSDRNVFDQAFSRGAAADADQQAGASADPLAGVVRGFAFPTHSDVTTSSIAAESHVGTELIIRLNERRRSSGFGRALAAKLANSRPIRRLRKASASPSPSGIGTPRYAFTGSEGHRPVLMGPPIASQHSRGRSDSAPEVWRGGGSAAGTPSGHRTRPSLPSSRIGSMLNVNLSRLSKRTSSTAAVGSSPGTAPSLLSSSRPAEHKASNTAAEAPQPTSLTRRDTAAVPAQPTAGAREPVLLRQRAAPTTLASRTTASASSDDGAHTLRSCDFFDTMLPQELKIKVFQVLVEQVVEEIRHDPSAVGHRLNAHERALQQLARLARVSRSWACLVLDGRLWSTLALTSFGGMEFEAMLRLSRGAGRFLRSLQLTGMSNMSSVTFMKLVKNTTGASPPAAASTPLFVASSIVTLDISHCSMLSSDALECTLRCMPALRKLLARSVPGFGDAALSALADTATGLEELDISGNERIGELGLLAVAGSLPALRVLKMSGVRGISKAVMAELATHATALEVLDLSYCKRLTDDMIAAFVTTDQQPRLAAQPITQLLPNPSAMADPFANANGTYRRITRLRALSVTGCRGLTNRACLLLAGSAPDLHSFEAGSIGPALRDSGVVALIRSTPQLERLDLDGASELTDAVIDSLLSHNAKHGCKITHLVLSQAGRLSPDALLELVGSCAHLEHLEVDDTRAGDAIAQEFAKVVRARSQASAYLSMVDCRGLTRPAAAELLSQLGCRPRAGKRGYAYRHFAYQERGRDSEPGSGDALTVELDSDAMTFKSFWGWQAVDDQSQRLRQARGRRRRAAVAPHDDSDSSTDEEEGRRDTRLGRLTSLLLTGGDDTDNAAGCLVM